MYPVVHRPTILRAYEQYLTTSGTLPDDTHMMIQLNLIFGVAALSSMVSPLRSVSRLATPSPNCLVS